MLIVAKVIAGLAFGVIGILVLLFPRKVYEFDQRLAPLVKSFSIYRALIWLLIGLPFTCIGLAFLYRIVGDSIK
jgi:hypothetical protein